MFFPAPQEGVRVPPSRQGGGGSGPRNPFGLINTTRAGTKCSLPFPAGASPFSVTVIAPFWENIAKAVTKPRTLETELSKNEMGSDGKAKFVRKAQTENKTKTAPREKNENLERVVSGERNRSV